MELLLVMLVMGMILGLGMGAFAAIDVGQKQASGLVKNVLRTAQNTSQSRGLPSLVRFDAQAGTARAEALRVIGTWQFEDEGLRGAFQIGGLMRGAVTEEEGYLGRALAFPPDVAGARAEFDVQKNPSFDLRDGFALSFVLERTGDGYASLVDVGGACGVQLLADGGLRGWFAPLMEDGGLDRKGPHVVCEADAGAVEVDRWTAIELVYDRQALQLSVNGTRVASTDEVAPVWAVEQRLVLGDRRRTWSGALDALVISAVDTGEAAELPEGYAFADHTPTEVHFDASGHLDRRYHEGPVTVDILEEGRPAVRLHVGAYGTVEADG